MAVRRAGVIVVDFVAQSSKLQADANQASGKLGQFGKSGVAAGKQIAAGMDVGVIAVRRVGTEAEKSGGSVRRHVSIMGTGAKVVGEFALAHVVAAAATAQFATNAAGSVSATEKLVTVLRTAKLAFAGYQSVVAGSALPLAFASASIAASVLVEEILRLVNARAKLIEQQSLFAANNRISFQSVDVLDATSRVSGRNPENVRSLYTGLQSQFANNQPGVQGALDKLGVSGGVGDPAILGRIARALHEVEDPARKAQFAVDLFGSEGGLALATLDQRFAKSSEAVHEWGIAIDQLSRTQIHQFRQDLLDLEESITDLLGLRTEVKSFWGGFQASLEMTAAASEDLAKRAVRALDEMVARYQPGVTTMRTLLAGMFAGSFMPHLTPSGQALPPVVPGAGQLGTHTAAGDMTDIEQQRKAQRETIEGQRQAADEAAARSRALYQQVKADDAAREQYKTRQIANPDEAPPPNLLTSEQRDQVAQAASSALLLSETLKRSASAMEAAKGITELLSQKVGTLGVEMRHSAEAADIAGKSEAARREAEANRVVEDARLEAAKKQIAATTKPGEAVLAPTAEQIAGAIPADKAEQLKRAALAEIEAADASKAHIRSIEAERAVTEMLSERFSGLRLEMEKAAVGIYAVGESEKRKRELEAEQFVQDARLEVAKKQVAAATPPGQSVPAPSASQIANAIPADEAARLKQEKLAQLTTQAELHWREEIDRTTDALVRRLQTLVAVNDAGENYEAQTKAKIEGELREQFGKDYDNPDKQEEIQSVRELKTGVSETEHADEIRKSNDELIRQIQLETALADAEQLSAAAVQADSDQAQKASDDQVKAIQRVATETQLEAQGKAELIGLTEQLKDAEDRRAKVKEASGNLVDQQSKIEDLGQQIEYEDNLAAAQLKGAEAVRKQQLANRLAELDRSSQDTPVFQKLSDLTEQLEEKKHSAEILKDALSTSAAYSDQLQKLKAEQAVIADLEAKQGATRDLEIDRERIEKDIADTLAKQALATGSLMDGLKAFFIEADIQAAKPGQILYDGLNHAVDGLSQSLEKAMTGQKANWGQMMKSIGDQMLQATIKSGIQKGLGGLDGGGKNQSDSVMGRIGKVLGVPQRKTDPKTSLEKRPLGTAADPVHTVTDTGGSKDQQQQQDAENKSELRTDEDGHPTLKRAPVGGNDGKLAPQQQTRPTGMLGDPVHVWVDNPSSGSESMQSGYLGVGSSGTINGAAAGAAAGSALSSGGGGSSTDAGVTTSTDSSITYDTSTPVEGYADGGTPAPNTAYMVGENGPELRVSSSRPDTIVPLNKMNGGRGGDIHNTYNIDNRGADIGAGNRTKQALMAVHAQSVKDSQRASYEQAQRKPQR